MARTVAFLLTTTAASFLTAWAASAATLTASLDEQGDRVLIHRDGVDQPIVTQVAKASFRPYLHPIVAPDGKGVLTEFSPGHHKHQTGLYWGFTRVNGRDYFHHPEGTHWKRISVSILNAEAGSPFEGVSWQTVYDLLDEQGGTVLRESQIWTLRDEGDKYLIDLDWSGEAMTDVTVGKYNYGGLFLRMPYRSGMNARVFNSARQADGRGEGGRAVWLDVGMQVDGRDDMAHIAIFDHPQNAGFPQPWRVDGQMGVGPVRARLGDWKIKKGRDRIDPTSARGLHRHVERCRGDKAVVRLHRPGDGVGPVASGPGRRTPGRILDAREGDREHDIAGRLRRQRLCLRTDDHPSRWRFAGDARGRLWIAENRDYETRQTGFSGDGGSRVLILEDTDRDGVADSRKVFVEGIPFPAGIAVGMGGLWLGAPPNLLFLPDRDGDDVADRDDIEVRLTGWGIRDRHETLNSFHWGPDGWLYGCQGYATPSKVGKPAGAGKLYKHNDPFPQKLEFDGDPVDINGGVWRYHPTKDRFEVVAHGFSNPWGIDYDAHGQLFITACVIPHLWHVIPGGIYHRQGGRHYNDHVYSDIRTIATHRHRSAHGGARVYLSDALPEKYNDRIFMANIHEHAVLTDIVHPKGSGFYAVHGDDFALANNAQWIGFSMEIAPDGSVFVLDWHDADICGKDVLNKETGRVFRIAPKESTAQDFEGRYGDLNEYDDLKLAELQTVASAWHARHARVILQHRSGSRAIDAAAVRRLREQMDSDASSQMRLRGDLGVARDRAA